MGLTSPTNPRASVPIPCGMSGFSSSRCSELVPLLEHLLHVHVEPLEPVQVVLHAPDELEVRELVVHREQRDARVVEERVQVQLVGRDPDVAEQRVLVLVLREDVVEEAEVQVVVVLESLGDVLALEIAADQVAGEDVPEPDEVRARRVERVGEGAGLADQRPAIG